MSFCNPIFDFVEISDLYKTSALPRYPKLPQALKMEQAQALHAILCKKDLICILPTGYGKTLCILMPSIIITKGDRSYSATLIVSPLVALMNDMTESIKSFGLAAYYITPATMKCIQPPDDGKPIYLLISPETLRLKDSKNLLLRFTFDLVAVDEGHTTFEWGSTFRKDYECLYEVRSFVECPLAVYTATVTAGILKEVKRLTGIRTDVLETIAITPDRANIFLEMRHKRLEMENLRFLLRDLLDDASVCDKTIVFAQSKNKVTEIFAWFHEELQEKGSFQTQGLIRGFKVDMYTSSTDSATKNEILAEFKKDNSFIRVLVATIAFGMGVDIPDVRRIVIWGQPSSPMTLWQEIGRAGRDGKPGTAIIFPQRTQTKQGSESNFVLPTEECTRKYILNQFFGASLATPSTVPHSSNCQKCMCCSYCKQTCGSKLQNSAGHDQSKRKMNPMQSLLAVIAPLQLRRKK